MPTNSPELQTAPEVEETLEQRIERLEKENAELKAENEKLKSKADQGNLKEEIAVNRLYGFGKLKINKAEVDNTLKNLSGEHKTKIEEFIKNDKIKDLQKYLNNLIDSGTISVDQLINNCNEKGMWLGGGHISEDGKFGPQTLEAIKILTNLAGGGSETPVIEGSEGGAEIGNDDTEEIIDPITGLSGKFNSLGHLVFVIDDLQKLPKNTNGEYKWIWIEKNGKRFPTYYEYKEGNKTYTFNSSGKCSVSGTGIYTDSQLIIDKIQRGYGSEEKFGSNLSLILPQIQNLSSLTFTEKGKSHKIGVKVEGKKIKLYLEEGKSTLTTKSGGNYLGEGKKTSTIHTYAYTTDISTGELLDNDGNFNKEYFESVLLSKAKKELMAQYTANEVMQGLIKVKKKGYSMEDIYGSEHSGNVTYLKYFNEMDDDTKKITFDDIRRDGEIIYFSLDNDGTNKSYNKVFAHYSRISENGEFSEKKLKEFLKKTIDNIMVRYH